MNRQENVSAPSPSAPPETNYQAVNRGMVKGSAWMIAMRLAIRFIGLISTIILARLLVPEDFGLVAIATMIYGFIEIMGQFGFDVVLIQKQDAGRDYYDTAWSLAIMRGVCIALILFAGAELAADFFDDERLVQIIYVLCVVALIEGFANFGIVDFRKYMDFGKDFLFMVNVKLCSFVVTLVAAFILRTHWALVLGILTSALARLGLSYFMHPFRPRWSVSRWREIMHFSKWLVLNNILLYVNQRSDSLIVGKILGAATLGLYTVAHEIATLATSELVAPIRRALLPGYAKLAHDPEALRRSFVDVFSLIIMLAAPLAVGIGLVADPIVRLLLGEQWLEVIPMLQLLAIFGLVQVLSSNTGPLLYAMGRARLVMMVTAVSVGISMPLTIFCTLHWGAIGTIWALIAGSCVSLIIILGLVLRAISLPFKHVFAAVWRSFVSLSVMIAAVLLVSENLFADAVASSIPAQLGIEITVGALSFVVAHLCLWRLCAFLMARNGKFLTAASVFMRRTQMRCSQSTFNFRTARYVPYANSYLQHLVPELRTARPRHICRAAIEKANCRRLH